MIATLLLLFVAAALYLYYIKRELNGWIWKNQEEVQINKDNISMLEARLAKIEIRYNIKKRGRPKKNG